MAKCGIYLILNLKNGKFYVGSSNDITNRKSSHFRALETNTHGNPFLQRDFNKTEGRSSFYFEILKEVPEAILAEEEQKYLDLLFDKQKRCYNIEKSSLSAGPKERQFHRRKTLTLISPTGELQTFTGQRHFARMINVSSGHVSYLLCGKVLSCKGWRLPETDAALIGKTCAKKYNVVFISPDGKEYSNVFNLEKFCKEHNLTPSCLRHTIAGRNETHKGWSVKAAS